MQVEHTQKTFFKRERETEREREKKKTKNKTGERERAAPRNFKDLCEHMPSKI